MSGRNLDDADTEAALIGVGDEFQHFRARLDALPQVVNLIDLQRLVFDDVVEGDQTAGAHEFLVIVVVVGFLQRLVFFDNIYIFS